MLTHVFDEDDVVICVDSLYAGNQLEGFWRVNCNKDLIDLGKDLLRQVREKRTVTFVHVKGHSEDGGNDRADLLVQWGKSDGPFSRMCVAGDGEGAGRFQAVEVGPVCTRRDDKPGEAAAQKDELEEEDAGETERQNYVFDQIEAMTSEDGLQAEERMRDSIGSAGSVLLASAWADESEEEEEEEKVEAEEKIQRVTSSIALGDRGSDRIETMEEIMQLERVTAAARAMTLDDEDEAVAALARRMRQCWISTIGYKIFPHKTKFVVSENDGSIRITVQGGSRGPTPNK